MEPEQFFENLLLTRLISDGTDAWYKLKSFGLDIDVMYEPFDAVFHDIEDYFNKHGVIPAKSYLEKKYPDYVPLLFSDEVPEAPVTAIYEEVRADHLRVDQRARIESWIEEFKGQDFDPSALLTRMSTDMNQLRADYTRNQQDSMLMSDAVDFLITELDKPLVHTGAATPFPFFQDAVGGLNPSEITTIVASTGQGKTWALLQMATTAIKGDPHHFGAPPDATLIPFEQQLANRKRVLVVSLEMDVKSIMWRLASLVSKVSYSRIKARVLSDEEKTKYVAALRELQDESVGALGTKLKVVGPNDAQDPEGVAAAAEEFDADIVIIDGFYYMSGEGDERWKKVETNMRLMRLHTLITGRHYVLATQFRRDAKTLASADLDSLAFSASIGHDSNNVLALFKHKQGDPDQILIVPLKIRDGAVGLPYVYEWNHVECRYGELGVYLENESFATSAANDML